MARSELSTVEQEAALDVVREMAPEELALCEDLLSPPTVWQRITSGGGGIGFGGTELIDFVSPYALIGVGWASSVVFDEAKSLSEEGIRSLARRLFGKVAVAVVARHSQDRTAASPESRIYELLLELGMKKGQAREMTKLILDNRKRRKK